MVKSLVRCMATLAFACIVTPAVADPGDLDLFSAESLSLIGDVRLVGADGERAGSKGGFGKLRFGGDAADKRSDFHLEPAFGEAALVWQPRLTWGLSGTVVALAQGGPDFEAGLSEAYLSWKPLSNSAVRLSARAGLMWPPVSLEHSGPEWAVTNSITPSAINSWIGEEVKVVGGELSASINAGTHKLSVTGGLFDSNDTAGALLAFRGWALHDRKILLGRRQPLPPLDAFSASIQPSFSHPTLEIDPGFFRRPGYYAKFAWDPPASVHLEYLHYDNDGDPEMVNADMEWGWRTRFDNVGLVAELSPVWQVRAQGMRGTTRMGFPKNGALWVDSRFRSAFALLTRQFARGSVSARVEAFGTRNRGSAVTALNDEDGWAVTVAARRSLDQWLTLLVEGLHVESRKDARSQAMVAAQQSGTQMQLSLRARW
ncbi:hypothetical protein [Sphingobium sp.]|uniref:hypothetical protein n=1 Tax=Sphingobium sp. TaxID=1912891 RepID=UPI0028BD7CB9|nr:hypothetical protein [Sphingobium sp.]